MRSPMAPYCTPRRIASPTHFSAKVGPPTYGSKKDVGAAIIRGMINDQMSALSCVSLCMRTHHRIMNTTKDDPNPRAKLPHRNRVSTNDVPAPRPIKTAIGIKKLSVMIVHLPTSELWVGSPASGEPYPPAHGSTLPSASGLTVQ